MSNRLSSVRRHFLPSSMRHNDEQVKILLNRLNEIETNQQNEINTLKSSLHKFQEDTAELKAQISVSEQRIKKLMDMYSLALLRNNDENDLSTKKRFFRALPSAQNPLKLYQDVNSKLLHELDAICRENNLVYWMWAGSAVAAEAQGSSIPWDDDIDICMMRDDFDKLKSILSSNEEYAITTCYDSYVFNRQYRFVRRGDKILNFIDIVPFDWAQNDDDRTEEAYQELKTDLCNGMKKDNRLKYWLDVKYLYKKTATITYPQRGVTIDDKKVAPLTRIIDGKFDQYRKKAISLNIISETHHSNYIAYGLDNWFTAGRKCIWHKNVIFPVSDTKYDGYDAMIAHNNAEFCDSICPNWPFIPLNLDENVHIPREIIDNEEMTNNMKDYLAKQ